MNQRMVAVLLLGLLALILSACGPKLETNAEGTPLPLPTPRPSFLQEHEDRATMAIRRMCVEDSCRNALLTHIKLKIDGRDAVIVSPNLYNSDMQLQPKLKLAPGFSAEYLKTQREFVPVEGQVIIAVEPLMIFFPEGWDT